MTAQFCRLPNIPNCLSHTQKKVLETCTHWSEENLRKHKGMLPLVSGQGHMFRSVLTPLPHFPFKSRSSWASQSEGHGPRARLWGDLSSPTAGVESWYQSQPRGGMTPSCSLPSVPEERDVAAFQVWGQNSLGFYRIWMSAKQPKMALSTSNPDRLGQVVMTVTFAADDLRGFLDT